MVSLVTATYNRSQFYDMMKKMVCWQDYPHDRMEWIIMDDSERSNAECFPSVVGNGIKVQYYHLIRKITLARKRDLLNHRSSGKYIINFDDDDYYPPTRVSHAVQMLEQNSGNLAGCGIMYMYFTSNRSIYRLGPYCANHATAATLAYSKAYSRLHQFGHGEYAEEANFTDNWKQPMIDLKPELTVLALSHSENTVDKNVFLQSKYGQLGVSIHPTDKKLEDFMSDQECLQFYHGLRFVEGKSTLATTEVLRKLETSIETGAQDRMVKRIINDLIAEQNRINVRRVIFERLPPLVKYT